MVTESQLIRRIFLKRWVLATFVGWLLGVVATILLDEISDGAHLGNQFAVGLGMGLGVGFAQWRIARKWFGVTSIWMWATVVAMGMPFVLTDVIAKQFLGNERIFLFLNVALGALLLGLFEWRILRTQSKRAHMCIFMNIVGWMLPTVGISLMPGGHPESFLAIIFNISVVAFGGVVLGIVSGVILLWMLPLHPSSS
jgi:hypothetical protein